MVGGVLLVISLESQKAPLWHAVVPSPQRDENTAFFLQLSLGGIHSKAFFRLSLWSFKEKSINRFYATAF